MFISNNIGEEFYFNTAGIDYYTLKVLPLDFHYNVIKFIIAIGFTLAGISFVV
jgi:hypothetical protein